MVKTTNIDKYGKKRRGKSLITGDCVFPFKYKGKIHNVCVDGKDGKWCATGVDPKRLSVKSWAFCLDEEEKIPEKQKKKSRKKINFDNIQILDEVDALEKESGKEKRGVVEKKNANKTLDIRFKDGYKFQSETPLKDIYEIYKYTGDKNQKITDENFDLILAKITFIAPNKSYNSLTFGHAKNKHKNGNWLVINPDVLLPAKGRERFKDIEDGLQFYIAERDYWQRKYDIINFEGFDDDLIRDKIPELSFEPVDLSTCKYDRSMLDDEVYLRDIPQNKVIQSKSKNCYDIDELVQYIISSNGKNVDPMDVIEGLSNPIWETEEELLFLRNFPTVPEEKKEQFQQIMDEQLAILRMPPYIDVITTEKGKEFLNRLIITGKICTEDYTNDFKPAQTEITRTREYLQDNFNKEEIDKIIKISTINGLNVEGVLLKNTGASCIHGVGFRFCSLYFSAFIKIRESLQALGKPFNIELFPGIVEVRPDVFMFCHGAGGSNYKTGAIWPLTGMIFDTRNISRGQNAGGCGRILKINKLNRKVHSEAVWGFSYDFADEQVPVFKKHYDSLTSMRPQNLLMQFADRPTGKKLSGKIHQGEDLKKTKKKSGKQVIKKTYKKQGRLSAYLKQKIRNDLNIYEPHNFNKITKVLPKGEIIKNINGEERIIKIDSKNNFWRLGINRLLRDTLLETFFSWRGLSPGLENGIKIDWDNIQFYPDQNNLNYPQRATSDMGVGAHTFRKSKFKHAYLKKLYIPIEPFRGENECVFELTQLAHQNSKYEYITYYTLTYSGITSPDVHKAFSTLITRFKEILKGKGLVGIVNLPYDGDLKENIFEIILQGYVDENYGDLEELESRSEIEQLREDSDSIDKAIIEAILPEEENEKREGLKNKEADLDKLKKKLFENSSSSKKSGEKKTQKEKSSSSKKTQKEKSSSSSKKSDEIIRTPSPKKKSPPKTPKNPLKEKLQRWAKERCAERKKKKSNEIDSDSFGKEIDKAIDDGMVVIRKKPDKIFDEIDDFAYIKDSNSSPEKTPLSPFIANDSPMRIEELDVPLRIEDLEVPEKSSSSDKKQNWSQEKQRSINNIAGYIIRITAVIGGISHSIQENLLQLANKFPEEKNQPNLIGYILDKDWDSVLKTARSMVNIKKKSSSSKDNTFNIYIKTLDGKTITIKTKSNDTVKNIMEKIQKDVGIPPLQVRLIYEMKRLPQIEDDDVNRKLSEFNIESECTFHLIYRLGPPVAPFKYRKSEWFPDVGKEIQLKKTQKKSSSSGKKTQKQKDNENIGKKYYGYDDKGRLINKDILGKTIVLYRSKDLMKWSIQVIQVRNRYKIMIKYDTKTKGERGRVYWWNPKNTDSKAAPDKLLQNMIDQGYKISNGEI